MRYGFFFYLVNFWTLLVFGVILYDFAHNNAYSLVLNPLLVLYVAILTIYVGAKEFERWFEYHSSIHPGELHVVAWTVLIVGIVFSNFILRRPYHLSEEIISTYISVLGILAITEKSKALYRTKHRH